MAQTADFVSAMLPTATDTDKILVTDALQNVATDDLQYLTESDILEMSRAVHEKKPKEFVRQDHADSSRRKAMRNLAFAVFGSVGAVAFVYVIYATLYRRTPLPIAEAVKVGTGVVSAARVAAAVMAHKGKDEPPAPPPPPYISFNQF